MHTQSQPCSYALQTTAHNVALADEAQAQELSWSRSGNTPPPGKGMLVTKRKASCHPLFIAEQQGKKKKKI